MKLIQISFSILQIIGQAIFVYYHHTRIEAIISVIICGIFSYMFGRYDQYKGY